MCTHILEHLQCVQTSVYTYSRRTVCVCVRVCWPFSRSFVLRWLQCVCVCVWEPVAQKSPVQVSYSRTSSRRNTLQHTATHCNTLQHTATHCNTKYSRTYSRRNPLLPTATHWNPLQLTATHCNPLQHKVLQDIFQTHVDLSQKVAMAGANAVRWVLRECALVKVLSSLSL